jgi:hypothetical protein
VNHYRTAASLMILAMSVPGLGSAGPLFYFGEDPDAFNQSLRLVTAATGGSSGYVITAESANTNIEPFDWFFDGDSALFGKKDSTDPVFPPYSLPRRALTESSLILQNDLTALSEFKLSSGLGGRFHDYFGNTTYLVTSLSYTPLPSVGLTLLYGEPIGAFDTVLGFLDNQHKFVRHESFRTMAIVYEQAISEGVRLSATGSYHMGTKSDLSAFERSDNLLTRPDYLGLGIQLEAKSSLNLEDLSEDDSGTQIEKMIDYLAEVRLMMPIVKDKVAAGMEIPKDIGFRLKVTVKF